MIKGVTYSFCRSLRFPVLFIMALCLTCCKKDDPSVTPVPPNPNPPIGVPTGVIEYFTIDDSLIGFNRTSIAKWLVSGTNALTRVTLSGDEIGFYGSRNTGRLKKDTVFTLAVNNGQQRTQKIFVADSIVTLLWNDDQKFAIKVKTEVTDNNGNWKDTTMADSSANARVFFTLKSSSTIIYIGTPSPKDVGPFQVTHGNTDPNNFVLPTLTWQGVLYDIITLDSQFLVLTYRQPDKMGRLTKWRDTYNFK